MPEIEGPDYEFRWTRSNKPPRTIRGKPMWEFVRFEVGDFGIVYYLYRRLK